MENILELIEWQYPLQWCLWPVPLPFSLTNGWSDARRKCIKPRQARPGPTKWGGKCWGAHRETPEHWALCLISWSPSLVWHQPRYSASLKNVSNIFNIILKLGSRWKIYEMKDRFSSHSFFLSRLWSWVPISLAIRSALRKIIISKRWELNWVG